MRLDTKLRFIRGLRIIFIFYCNGLVAQQYTTSRYEKLWAFVHPFAAIKVKLISTRCHLVFNQIKGCFKQPHFLSGGKPDALRHVFYMAAYAQKIRAGKLRQLGLAHEKSNYMDFKKFRSEHGETPDSLASVMDIFNNEVGIALGHRGKKLPLKELAALAVQEVEIGNTLIFKRKTNGIYLDCNNQEINPDNYKGRWFVPKCLVPSNTPYID